MADLFGGKFVDRFVSDAKSLAGVKSVEDTGFCIVTSYWGNPASHQLNVSYDTLVSLKDDWNIHYRPTYGILLDICKYSDTDLYALRVMSIGDTPVQKLLYLSTTDNRMLVSSPDAGEDDAKWIPLQSLRSPYHLLSTSDFYSIAADVNGKIRTSGDKQFIFNAAQNRIYADGQGRAYYIWAKDSAIDSDRDTDTIIKVDGDGNETTVTVDGDNTQIDIANGTFTAPDGTIQILDGIVYDESTHTYYIDSHDSYTTNIYNYYTYQYYINYTSITYIGYTEQYDKHYEVYYKLPDGRSSADLTAEELEQLNLSIDVINYGRSADDVSLRSLYHFDGDTDDASYWNYCTDFTWNKGASLTYMDEGTFEGSLYLDETEHDFTLTLPSGLMGDFTLQFRYYQSATAAPQTDSYIKLGTATVMQFDGANIKNGSGTVLSTMPIGTWNELALIRDSGTLYYYLNGVKIGSVSQGIAWQDLNFHFGGSQQTWKKLDELRVLNSALQTGGASYTPTSVPHDTNLALVLPDSAKPVADEYWAVDFHEDATYSANFTNGGTLADAGITSVTNLTASVFPTGLYLQPATHLDPAMYEYVRSEGGVGTFRSEVAHFSLYLQDTSTTARGHQISFVFDDGTVFDYRFFMQSAYYNSYTIVPVGSSPPFSGTQAVDFPGGFFILDPSSKNKSYSILVVFDPSSAHNIVAIERTIIEVPYGGQEEAVSALSARSAITAEHITSITAMTPEDLATPTLAVRSDIPVTSWQIGGVRPSVPVRGQVWALVERQYITSLQIYNGRAWETCDGRIWTGSRWVPYSSYNVVTLKDMSDIVDSSSPDKEYIYTESGFWDWLQRFLTGFKKELFARLDKLKGSGGSASSSAVPAVPSGSGSYDFSDGSEDVTIPKAAKDSAGGLLAFIKGAWKLVGGAFKNAGKAVSDLTDAGDTTNPDGAYGFFLIPLEEEGG